MNERECERESPGLAHDVIEIILRNIQEYKDLIAEKVSLTVEAAQPMP